MEKIFTKYSFEIVFVGIGILAGFVRASQKMLNGSKITWVQLVGHSVISAFSCLMAGVLLDWLAPQFPLEAKLFVAGMTGYLGIAGLVRLIEQFSGRWFKGGM